MIFQGNREIAKENILRSIKLSYPYADGMNGVLAELVLQFSQQGSLPLLEMVAHGWLKHLDGGTPLTMERRLDCWPRNGPAAFSHPARSNSGSIPSPSRGSLDRISPAGIPPYGGYVFHWWRGISGTSPPAPASPPVRHGKDNHTGRGRRGDPDGLCPASRETRGGGHGENKSPER